MYFCLWALRIEEPFAPLLSQDAFLAPVLLVRGGMLCYDFGRLIPTRRTRLRALCRLDSVMDECQKGMGMLRLS